MKSHKVKNHTFPACDTKKNTDNKNYRTTKAQKKEGNMYQYLLLSFTLI